MKLTLVFLLLFAAFDKPRLNHQETITRTLSFTSLSDEQQLVLKNVSGNVQVKGYDGKEVKITVEKTIEANNQDDLQRGIQEIQLEAHIEGNTMLVYMDAPFVTYEWTKDNTRYQVKRYHNYEYRMDFTVQVPRNLNLNVSTVNGELVAIEKVRSGKIKARNVNGSVRCTGVSGQTEAVTVNGDVDVQFAKAPTADSQFKTINGDITLLAPEDLSADVSFKTMNGDFYTNYETLDYLPAEVSTNEKGSGKRTTYRIDRTTKLRVGKGGPLLQTETLNGEVYLKHN